MEQPANGSLDGGQGSTLQTRSTPGAMLRAARESRGLSREQLCEAIQLERRLLDALEEDRFEAFDAPVFARGFLRKSATHLGLDPVVVLEGYDRLHRGPEAPSHIPPTTRITPRRVSPWRLPLLGVAALLLVGGVIWWIVVMLGGLGATPSTATPTEESLLAGNDSTAFTPAAAENAAMVPAGETQAAAVWPLHWRPHRPRQAVLRHHLSGDPAVAARQHDAGAGGADHSRPGERNGRRGTVIATRIFDAEAQRRGENYQKPNDDPKSFSRFSLRISATLQLCVKKNKL